MPRTLLLCLLPLIGAAEPSRAGAIAVMGHGWKALCGKGPAAGPADVHFLADGRLLILSHSWHNVGGLVSAWDARAGVLLGARHVPVRMGTREETADRQCRVIAEQDHDGWRLTEMDTGRALTWLAGGTSAAHAPCFSPDGRRVLLAEHLKEKDRYLFRWFDTARGRELGRIEVPFKDVHPRPAAKGVQPVWFPASWYARDGSVIGYRTLDSRLVLVDCATGKAAPPIGTPLPMTWEAASKAEWIDATLWRYESVGRGQAVAAWRHVAGRATGRVLTRRGEVLRRLRMHYEAFTPDLRLAARATTRGIVIVETATGHVLHRIELPGIVHGLAVSPEGTLLAARHDDGLVRVWDIGQPLGGRPTSPAPKAREEAGLLWERLADPDPREAEQTVRALARAPAVALALLKERLRPSPAAKEASAWVAALDAEEFEEREAAQEKLLRLGEQALPHLYAAACKPLSLEQSKRAKQIIARIEDGPPACLRGIRALEVLERIGGPEARRLVERIAAGDPGALRTREARLILDRSR